VSQILEASETDPYLSLRLELDPVLVGSVIAELDQRASRSYAEARAVYVSELDSEFLDAAVRFVRLVDSPIDIPARGDAGPQAYVAQSALCKRTQPHGAK